MSLALKQSKMNAGAASGGAFMSRSQFQGDPGLFGFLGKAAGGILKTAGGLLPGPIGTIAGTIGGALAGSKARQAVDRVRTGGFAPQQVPSRLPTINPPFAGPPGAGIQLGPARVGFGENVGQNGTKLACPSGFHPNKSSYFLKDGTFVPEGSKCVKNRRKNPLNPRAASRAISRLESAKKATKRLDRVSIKCKRCGCARCKC